MEREVLMLVDPLSCSDCERIQRIRGVRYIYHQITSCFIRAYEKRSSLTIIPIHSDIYVFIEDRSSLRAFPLLLVFIAAGILLSTF